jgi:hypothetical protein
LRSDRAGGGNEGLSDPRALRRDLVRGSVLTGLLKRLDSFRALDLGKHVGLHDAEPFAVGQAVAFGDKGGTLREFASDCRPSIRVAIPSSTPRNPSSTATQ